MRSPIRQLVVLATTAIALSLPTTAGAQGMSCLKLESHDFVTVPKGFDVAIFPATANSNKMYKRVRTATGWLYWRPSGKLVWNLKTRRLRSQTLWTATVCYVSTGHASTPQGVVG